MNYFHGPILVSSFLALGFFFLSSLCQLHSILFAERQNKDVRGACRWAPVVSYNRSPL
jgi:hypothetical protein